MTGITAFSQDSRGCCSAAPASFGIGAKVSAAPATFAELALSGQPRASLGNPGSTVASATLRRTENARGLKSADPTGNLLLDRTKGLNTVPPLTISYIQSRDGCPTQSGPTAAPTRHQTRPRAWRAAMAKHEISPHHVSRGVKRANLAGKSA